jgi:Pyruvate/2-oxoacid:ferredoxin oxidoreductase delta subunit
MQKKNLACRCCGCYCRDNATKKDNKKQNRVLLLRLLLLSL